MEKKFDSWENVYEAYYKYVRSAANKTYLQNRNVGLDADDLYQEGLMTLYDCYERYGHLSEGEFYAVFTKSVWRTVRRRVNVNRRNNHNSTPYDEIEFAIGETQDVKYNEELLYDVYEDLSELKSQLSNLAAAILCELINPSPKTYWYAEADYFRKEFAKKQGKSKNALKRIRPNNRHIRKALGITTTQFERAMREIREIATKMREEGAFV